MLIYIYLEKNLLNNTKFHESYVPFADLRLIYYSPLFALTEVANPSSVISTGEIYDKRSDSHLSNLNIYLIVNYCYRTKEIKEKQITLLVILSDNTSDCYHYASPCVNFSHTNIT